MQNSGVPVHTGGDRAFYNPLTDHIQVPPTVAFKDATAMLQPNCMNSFMPAVIRSVWRGIGLAHSVLQSMPRRSDSRDQFQLHRHDIEPADRHSKPHQLHRSWAWEVETRQEVHLQSRHRIAKSSRLGARPASRLRSQTAQDQRTNAEGELVPA